MGRPLTDKWIGNPEQRTNPVLMPYCNINGTETYCYILRQIGSNKFIVQSADNQKLISRITLTDGLVANPGKGYLRWETLGLNGYVARLTDNAIRTFDGHNMLWSIYNNAKSATTAYIINNSSEIE